MSINPVVVDLSHYDDVNDWDAVYKFGIRGVINKATQGTGMVDKTCAIRKGPCIAHGMLWGAYHFLTAEDGVKQADHFLEVAKPDAQTLVALDYEQQGVSVDHARDFLRRVLEKLGRKAVFYLGGAVRHLVGRDDAFFGSHRLWHPQYGSTPSLVPSNWPHAWLWQYTGDGLGLSPHNVPGITIGGKGIDINHWGGTEDELRAQWAL